MGTQGSFLELMPSAPWGWRQPRLVDEEATRVAWLKHGGIWHVGCLHVSPSQLIETAGEACEAQNRLPQTEASELQKLHDQRQDDQSRCGKKLRKVATHGYTIK